MQYRIEDEFECSAARYWDVFFDPKYNQALFDHLDIEYEQLEFRREGDAQSGRIYRVQRLTPRREMPAVMQKILRGAITYTETNDFDAAKNAMEVRTVPNLMSDKITTRGQYRLESRGDQRIVRVWEGECNCKIPLVGSKIEQAIVDEVKRSYAATTQFTRRWLKEHPAT